MNNKFSVLMSVYVKEQTEYVRQCFESLLAQTTPAAEWIIVEDGPLTKELYRLLQEYQNRYPTLITRITMKENQGLGLALREGIKHCRYALVARMDTDDIALPYRFEKQLRAFQDDPTLDICGGQVNEFEGDITHIVSSRRVPLEDAEIKRYQKRRDAFNHMSVMFKKEAVLNAGNYQHLPLMEDTLLWCNMILSGVKCRNLDEILVLVRIGNDMFKRRGGWSYFLKYYRGRKMILKTGYISRWDYWLTLSVQFVVTLVPVRIRAIFFKKILHH